MTLPSKNSQSLKYRGIWLIMGWIFIFSIIYLTLTPRPPQVIGEIKFGDKIGHLSAYFLLMFWFCQLYIEKYFRIKLACTFILMGILLELLQKLGGIRMYEVADMLANTAGVLIGFALAYFGLNDFLYRLEKIMESSKAS